jgi:Dolichyl-phosphate-mannose-protein mannosyltransferase
MADSHTTSISHNTESSKWWRHYHLILPLAFMLAMFLFFPYRERFEFDQDEGVEAMKALLLARGHPLYSEVWSEQPPLFTYLLAACFRVFGPDIDMARSLVVLLSTLLLAASAQLLRSTWGNLHAIAGVLLIFLLPFYTALSASAMVGLPAIAFAVLSLLALTAWHSRRQERWLLLSALVLALSVLTKLFTAFLAPIFVLGILLDERARQRQVVSWYKLLRPALLWCLGFAIVVLGCGLLIVGPENLRQLLSTHLVASQSQAYIGSVIAQPISWHLREAWPILLLGLPGSAFVLLRRRWISLYLIAWTLVAYVTLSFYAPVWYHHQLLVTIPAAMLAAIAVGEALRSIPRIANSRAFLSANTFLTALSLIGFIIALANRAPLVLPDFYRPPVFVTHAAHAPWPEQMFLTKMSNHAPETHWVVTDLPMYAFRVGLLVPPYLAVSSTKRRSTGDLTEQQFITIIDEYKPEQVLIGRSEYPEIEMYLNQGYRVLYTRGKRLLYLRKDLKGQ